MRMRKLRRRDFHRIALAGGAALAQACAQGTQGTAQFASGQAVLAFAQFPALASPGGSVVVSVPGYFPMVVVRTAADAAVALSATCTHAFCTMSFDSSRNAVHCACHDGNFALDGSVISGPPKVPIPVYAATVAADSITVQIEA
jgi:cytochrome b6-f complex iron-sulfur subunit